ncbi:HOG (high osmolarity glycerol) pathway protein, partial [Cryomyces antarcticus]
MAAVLSPQTISTSPSPVSLPARLPASSNPNLAQLPPLVTSPPLQPARPPTQRAPSHASQKRMSTYSNTQSRSRPQSTVFPAFHTSLPYALVRDFAYPDSHPLHYGPPPEPPSGLSTPASEYKRRLSDLPETWDSKGHWSAGPWGANEALYGGNQRQTGGGQQLPSTSFTTFSEGDGPPWSEDEDLHSPVVTSSRHKKQKSSLADVEQRRGRSRNSIHAREERQSPYMKRDKGGSASGAHQISGPSASAANGPGVEYITYSPGTLSLSIPSGETNPRRDSHFATLPNRTFHSQSLHESPESDLPEDEDSELDPSEPTESPYRTDED